MADDIRREDDYERRDPDYERRRSDPVPEGDRVVGSYDRDRPVRRERVHHDDDRGFLPAAIRRISWGAIIAGTVVAIVVQLMLNLLGMGFGLSAIDPAQEANPFSGLGTGTIIWLVLVTLISLFIGGWIAGRMAGLPRRLDGALHGFVAWGLATLLSLYLLTSAVGTVISGVTGIVGQGLDLAGQGVAAVAPEAREALREQGVTLSDIQQEARQLLRQSGLRDDVAQTVDTLQAEAGDVARTPASAQQDLDRALEELLETGREADRQNVVNIMVANTDMSEAEARRTVEQYEQRYRRVRERVSTAVDSVRQTAVRVSGRAADTLSTVGYVAFFAMLIGAIASAAGGAAGAPKDLPASSAVRRE